MAIVTWKGGSLGADQGRYETNADWSGGQAPRTGDTIVIDGIANTGITKSGEAYVFPLGAGYTLISLFPQGASGVLGSGYTITGQTLELMGVPGGPPDLWLQGTRLTSDSIDVTGAAVLNAYLNDIIGGTIHVGGGGHAGLLQLQIAGVGVNGAGAQGGVPATTLSGHTTVAGGSTLAIIAQTSEEPPDNLKNLGQITILGGGTLLADDTDGFGVQGTTNGTQFINTGLIDIEGAAGRVTSAGATVDLVGGGGIDVIGNGAVRSATTLSIEGNVTNQHIVLDDGTIAISDSMIVNGDPSQHGFAVTGGLFTFGAHGGTLVLHQPPLTMLQPIQGGARFVQLPDGQHPFTTPIAGFGAGDVIELVHGTAPGERIYTVWNQAKNLLSVQFGYDAQYPGIQAQFTLQGSYQASGFHLAVDHNTNAVSITYSGPHG